MTHAQRRRDSALRRLRLANRGGVVASIAGAAILVGLAHQATPVGRSRRVATQVVVKRDPRTARSDAKQVASQKSVTHQIRPAAAPTAVTNNSASTSSSTVTNASAPATSSPTTSVVTPIISGAS